MAIQTVCHPSPLTQCSITEALGTILMVKPSDQSYLWMYVQLPYFFLKCSCAQHVRILNIGD